MGIEAGSSAVRDRHGETPSIAGLSATTNKSHIETSDLAAPLYRYSTLVVVIFPAVEKSLNGEDAALSAEMSSGVCHSRLRGSGDERVTA